MATQSAPNSRMFANTSAPHTGIMYTCSYICPSSSTVTYVPAGGIWSEQTGQGSTYTLLPILLIMYTYRIQGPPPSLVCILLLHSSRFEPSAVWESAYLID